MQSLSHIRQLLSDRGLRPKHVLGQNFLHDHNQLRKLVDAADVQPGELILEIGPGTGTLTETLLEAGADVIACELDSDMAGILRDETKPRFPEKLTIIEGDCLASKHAINAEVLAALDRPFKLVANLPYQITSPLLATLLIDHCGAPVEGRCLGMFVTVQKEAGDRLLSPPGTKDYGPLAILVTLLAESERLATLPPSCFWPAPKVTSAMLAIRPFAEPVVTDARALAVFLQRLFQTRRKQIGSILGRSFPFPPGIDPMSRPEQLKPEAILDLWAKADEV